MLAKKCQPFWVAPEILFILQKEENKYVWKKRRPWQETSDEGDGKSHQDFLLDKRESKLNLSALQGEWWILIKSLSEVSPIF